MRSVIRSFRAVAALVVALSVAIACSSSPGSPGLSTSSPVPSRTTAPRPSASPAVAAPTLAPTPDPGPTQRTIESPGPSFSHVELVCIGEEEQQCALHRTDDAGMQAPGWPIELDGRVVDLSWNDVTIGCGDAREPMFRAGIDDLTFVGVAGPAGPEIRAYESWGLMAPGWPQPFPAPDGECHGMMATPSGEQVVAWGYEGVQQDIELIADRTEFTMFDLRGRTIGGWPRGSEGAASGPVSFQDGIAYVSATGRVWAHDGHGDVRPGWGYRLMDRSAPMSDGSHIAIAQRIADIDDVIVVLGLDGKPLPGFPLAVNGELETRCLFGDTPCAGHVGPTLAPDGTVYVALGNARQGVSEGDPTGGRIEAYGPTGRPVEGWLVQLAEWSHVIRIGWSVEGAVIATVVVCAVGGCTEVDRVEEHWYGMDGRLVSVHPVEPG